MSAISDTAPGVSTASPKATPARRPASMTKLVAKAEAIVDTPQMPTPATMIHLRFVRSISAAIGSPVIE